MLQTTVQPVRVLGAFIGSFLSALLLVLVPACRDSSVEARVIAENIELGPSGLDIAADPPIEARRSQQTLVLESDAWAAQGSAAAAALTSAGMTLKDGGTAVIVGSLIDREGRETAMRVVAVGGEPAGVQLSSAFISRNARYSSIRLRSSIPITVKRVRWVCQATH